MTVEANPFIRSRASERALSRRRGLRLGAHGLLGVRRLRIDRRQLGSQTAAVAERGHSYRIDAAQRVDVEGLRLRDRDQQRDQARRRRGPCLRGGGRRFPRSRPRPPRDASELQLPGQAGPLDRLAPACELTRRLGRASGRMCALQPDRQDRAGLFEQTGCQRTLAKPGMRSNCPAARKQTRQAAAPVTANLTSGGAGMSRQASATPTNTGGRMM